MLYEFRIVKGLRNPRLRLFQLAQAETIYGLRSRLVWLFIVSAFLFAVSGMFGLGTHVFSHELNIVDQAGFEWRKSFFVLGRFVFGLVYAAGLLFLPALWFWTLTEVPYAKLLTLQALVLPVHLLEQAVYIWLASGLDLPWYSSFFSLGVLAQYITSHLFPVLLLGCVSLFKVWVMAIQYTGLREMTGKPRITLAGIILAIHLIFWLLAALMGYINVYKIL